MDYVSNPTQHSLPSGNDRNSIDSNIKKKKVYSKPWKQKTAQAITMTGCQTSEKDEEDESPGDQQRMKQINQTAELQESDSAASNLANIRLDKISHKAAQKNTESPVKLARIAEGLRTDSQRQRSPQNLDGKNTDNQIKTENSKIIKKGSQHIDGISEKSPGTLKDESLYKSGFESVHAKGSYQRYDLPEINSIKNKNQEIIQKSFFGKDKMWEAWERHHCQHCEHAKVFPVSQTKDLGSLKLKDILKFQQDGRCCKSFCAICRKKHNCEYQKEMKIIDYERGAEASFLMKTTPRPFDIEMMNLTGQKLKNQSKSPVREEPQMQQSFLKNIKFTANRKQAKTVIKNDLELFGKSTSSIVEDFLKNQKDNDIKSVFNDNRPMSNETKITVKQHDIQSQFKYYASKNSQNSRGNSKSRNRGNGNRYSVPPLEGEMKMTLETIIPVVSKRKSDHSIEQADTKISVNHREVLYQGPAIQNLQPNVANNMDIESPKTHQRSLISPRFQNIVKKEKNSPGSRNIFQQIQIKSSKHKDNNSPLPAQAMQPLAPHRLLDIQNIGRQSLNSMVSAASPIKLKSTFFFGSKAENDNTPKCYPYQFMHTRTLKQASQEESQQLLRLNLETLKQSEDGSIHKVRKNSSCNQINPAINSSKVTSTIQDQRTPRGDDQVHLFSNSDTKKSRMIVIKNTQDSQDTIQNDVDDGTARRKNEDDMKPGNTAYNSIYFNYDLNNSSFIVQPAGSGSTTLRAPPFKVKLDNKKKEQPSLEVKGDKKMLNQNYINLQHQISKQLKQDRVSPKKRLQSNEKMYRMANQAFHEIDVLIQESAAVSPIGSKDQFKMPLTKWTTDKGHIKVSSPHSRTSLNSGSLGQIIDEDELTASQHPFNARYQGQQSFISAQKFKDSQQMGDTEKTEESLEIKGKEMQRYDPAKAQKKFNERNQMIKILDKICGTVNEVDKEKSYQYFQGDPYIELKKKENRIANKDLSLHSKFPTRFSNNDSIAAGTSSSFTANRIGGQQNQFMIDDIRLFRDFVLYYNKNRFKKYKYKHMNDQIFLNQPQITEQSIGLDLYYKMREQKNIEDHIDCVQQKIQGKMDEILGEWQKHREKLIKQGQLIEEEEDKSIPKDRENSTPDRLPTMPTDDEVLFQDDIEMIDDSLLQSSVKTQKLNIQGSLINRNKTRLGSVLQFKSVNKSFIKDAMEKNDYIQDIKMNYAGRPVMSWQTRRINNMTQSLDSKPMTATSCESKEYFEYLSNKRAILPVLQTSDIQSTNFNVDLYHFKRQVNSKSSTANEQTRPSVNKYNEIIQQKQILNNLLVPANHASQLTTPKSLDVEKTYKFVEKKLESEINALSSNMGNLSPKLEARDIKTPADLPIKRKKLFNSIDFGNSLNTKRLMRNQKHMINFEQIKPQEFTQAKLKMRNFKEESDRLLGPQFNKENIRRMEKQAKEKAEREQAKLTNFFKVGVINS